MAQAEITNWRKARPSLEGNCVEVGSIGDTVCFRNSKDRDGNVLTFNRAEWTAFVAGIGEGNFEDI
jgi:hypothetical protein